ncbi:MAG: ATP12 family protein [Celeribacter sp.]|jgi:chaperone required for assembly of F1-ATPase
MTEWKRKRFWTDVTVAPAEGTAGWNVLLDGRCLRTPAKAELILPTRAMAEATAEEWRTQTAEIDPETMPVTRAANSALDKVTPQRDEVIAMLADYGESDLLCYRAEAPQELALRQSEAWDPLLDWARAELGADLKVTAGIMPHPQPATARTALYQAIDTQTAHEITALHDLVALSGSLIIGLAAQAGVHPAAELWRRSRIDESWQEEHWGVDEDAAALALRKHGDFMNAAYFYDLCRESAG